MSDTENTAPAQEPVSTNGKGDKPRSNFTKDYRMNYDNISWDDTKTRKRKRRRLKRKARGVK